MARLLEGIALQVHRSPMTLPRPLGLFLVKPLGIYVILGVHLLLEFSRREVFKWNKHPSGKTSANLGVRMWPFGTTVSSQ